MKKKTERPLFNYLVRVNSSFDYYLYENFNDAIEKARQLSRDDIGVLFEVYFNTQTREFFGKKHFLYLMVKSIMKSTGRLNFT